MKYRLNESLYSRASTSIDAIYCEMRNMSAVEGLNSNFFGRLLVSVADTFTGICSTAASNVARLSKSIKRGELHEFVDSNRLKMRTVDDIPYSRLVGFEVDVPANLQGTYKNAINNISQVYIRLNTLNTAKLLQTTLINIYTSLSNGDGRSSGLISSTASVIQSIIKASNDTVQDCHRNFSGSFVRKAKYEDVFLTKEEWVESRNMLIELEPRLQEAKTIRETLERIEATLKNICSFMGDNPDKLGQKDVMNFGETVKRVAFIMDGYNLAITRQMALEHNYVLMTNAIYAGVK